MVIRVFDTLGRMTDRPAHRAVSSATSSVSGARIRAAATPGSSTGSAPTSACAAGPADRHVLVDRRTVERRLAGVRRARRPGPQRRGGAAAQRPVTAGGTAPATTAPDGGRARRLQEPAVPPPLARPGGDPDRREHGHLRPDRHHRGVDRLDDRGQRPDPHVPPAGGAVLGAGRRLRRPPRSAARPDRRRTSCAASPSSRSTSSATTSGCSTC